MTLTERLRAWAASTSRDDAWDGATWANGARAMLQLVAPLVEACEDVVRLRRADGMNVQALYDAWSDLEQRIRGSDTPACAKGPDCVLPEGFGEEGANG